jgi:tetrahydromethanopterin S-methyltransferase subunit A/NAD-dependent dihydropyrimidine dehydrogenase PreA subunit
LEPLAIDPSKCDGCGKCVEACPEKVLEQKNGRGIPVATGGNRCVACHSCESACPAGAIHVEVPQILKVEPPADYPPEEGRYLRGNDLSPVAVVAILDTFDFKIPPELDRLVKVAVESGAALAGTLQTENLGIEKVIANVVANPNIRYLILCWRESKGHLPADALINLVKNGVAKDKRRTIVGAQAPTPYLPNIPLESIERFRRQVKIVNLISEEDPRTGMDPENVRKAVWACIQERPTKFMDYELYDPGAYPEPPICQKITLSVKEPWRPELSEREREILAQISRASTPKSAETPSPTLAELLGIEKKPKS